MTSDALFPPDYELELTDLMLPLVARNDVAGVVRIEHAGQTRYAAAYGLANREHSVPNALDTRFLIGSISKQFTAAGVLVLQDQGSLDLQDRLERYLPGFPHGGRITLRQLLSHTSGLSRDLPCPAVNTRLSHTLEQIVELIAAAPPAAEPGATASYSNNGYRVLARVIELVSGRSYGAFIQEAVLRPAGMLDSGIYRDQDLIERLANGYCPWPGPGGLGRAPYAAAPNTWGPGAIYSTAADLALWSQALATDTVLSGAARTAMLTPVSDGRGLGISVYERFGRRCCGHDGVYFGYTASFEKYLDDDLTIIYLGNVETGSLGAIRPALPAIVFGQPYPPPPARPGPFRADSAGFRDYIGGYHVFPGLVLNVSQVEDVLLLGAGESDFPLDPIGPDRFYYRLKYATVTFERDGSGAVAALNWEEGAHLFRCEKVG